MSIVCLKLFVLKKSIPLSLEVPESLYQLLHVLPHIELPRPGTWPRCPSAPHCTTVYPQSPPGRGWPRIETQESKS